MFISYASHDIDFIRELVNRISISFEGKLEVMISADNLEIGSNISRKITRHMEESNWYMVLLTQNSIKSSIVLYEYGYASALFQTGLVTQVIPIVERFRDADGKDRMIDTHLFLHDGLELPKFSMDRDRWDECLTNILGYLEHLYQEEQNPHPEILEERAKQMAYYDLNWEGATALKAAGIELIVSGEFEKGIQDMTLAAEKYRSAEYNWESAKLYSKIAKYHEEKGNVNDVLKFYSMASECYISDKDYWEAAQEHNDAGRFLLQNGEKTSAANEYRRKGEIMAELAEEPEEAGNAWLRAGRLFCEVGDTQNAKRAFHDALEQYEEAEYEGGMERIRGFLERIEKDGCSHGDE